ncbi:type IV secretion system protein [Rhizobium leguminosarum]|uniref:type IV secretion system protein n=1 Tax=Rhizobium leguminosarum TaxID=384 RepID=UPI0024A8DE58|nr:type IV secretion system protein [Rhizobium leguminosarum]MDI5930210.1 type IV secretion system protein [Rhizobium leguminosarum]
MKRHLRASPLAISILLFQPGGSAVVAHAQAAVTPLPEPAVGGVPGGPPGVQETHDQVSIEQIMKLVQLSRIMGGGITQMFTAIQNQKSALDVIRNGQTGPKTIPLLNGPDEVAARQGGEGLREMADGALNGAADGPPDLLTAFTHFRSTFSLDKAFALKDDELPSKKVLAQLAAKGAIAGSVAESSYKRANASMERVDDYIAAVQASKDLKTSIDINTRAVIELTQQTNESLRTQSAVTSIVSSYLMMFASEASTEDWIDGLKDFNR